MRGPHAHAVYVLGPSATFGRGSATDVQILDQRVSRQHARVTLEADGSVVLTDLSSCNGTYVHGSKITRRTLCEGDRIQIGFAEYVYECIPGGQRTSSVFENKLTNRGTLGTTIVRKSAKEMLDTPTRQMPALQPRPLQLPQLVKEQAEPAAVAVQPPEPGFEFREEPPPPAIREIELPSHAPTGWSDSAQRPMSFAPRTSRLLSPEDQARLDDETQPLSIFFDEPQPSATEAPSVSAAPQTAIHSSPQPRAEPRPAPQPAPAAGTSSQPSASPRVEAAHRAIDAVMRMLALRHREASGQPLKVQDRVQLRKLEQALRESNRGRDNRRRWARLPCQLGAEVDEGASRGVVSDVGAGGLCVQEVNLVPAIGDELSIGVRLGDDRYSRVAVFSTRVVWVDSGHSSFGAIFAGPARWELAG